MNILYGQIEYQNNKYCFDGFYVAKTSEINIENN